MILTGQNRSAQNRTCSHATLSTTNPTWTGLESNLCLDRIATLQVADSRRARGGEKQSVSQPSKYHLSL